MATVHVFSSTARFGSFEDLRAFVEPSYSEDGDEVPSRFMTEVGLEECEPMCIEVFKEPEALPLGQLVEGASYGEQWIQLVDASLSASEAICVFEPNEVLRPSAASSVVYCGGFEYRAG